MLKRVLLGSVVASAVALALTGGVVLAQTVSTESDSPLGSLISRVASILGIEEETLTDAIAQASKDVEDEARRSALDRLVEEGVLETAEADEIMEWYLNQPEALRRQGGLPGLGMKGRFYRHGTRGMERNRFFFGMPYDLPQIDGLLTPEMGKVYREGGLFGEANIDGGELYFQWHMPPPPPPLPSIDQEEDTSL